MFRRYLLIRSSLLLALTYAAAFGQQPSASLKAHLNPEVVVNGDRSQLVLEVTSTRLEKAHVEVSVPSGFSVEPAPLLHLLPFQNSYSDSSLSIRSTSGNADVHPYPISVRLVDDSGTSPSQIVETHWEFNYLHRMMIPDYFLWGAIGIVFGYAIRLIVRTLQTVTPPPAAPGMNQTVGPITAFVTKHYYFVDCSVTLLIGFICMELLIKNNHAPDTAPYWYSAFGSGVALGVLTNSELLLKLR